MKWHLKATSYDWYKKWHDFKFAHHFHLAILFFYVIAIIAGSLSPIPGRSKLAFAANGSWNQPTFNGTNDGTYSNTQPANSNADLSLKSGKSGLSNAGGSVWNNKREVIINNTAGGELTDYSLLLDSEKDVVGDWHFDEGSGANVYDSSSQNLTGTLSGSSYRSTGIYGNAFVGNGSANKFTVSHNAALNLPTALSIEFYVKFNEESVKEIITKNNNTNSGPGAFEIYQSNKRIAFRLVKSGTMPTVLNNTDLSTGTNTWYHVVGTWDGSSVKIYINGVLDSSPFTVASPIDTSTGNITVGSYGNGLYPFNGSVDELRIYNKALSDTEVNSRKNNGGIWQKIKADGSDIRFTDTDQNTELGYWIESFNNSVNTKNYKVWVKVPVIAASSNKSIYMYYDNVAATSSGNGENAFIFFDSFNSGNMNKWDLSTNWGVATDYYYTSPYSAKSITTAPYNLQKNITNTAAVYEGWFRFSNTNQHHYLSISSDGSGRSNYWGVARNNGYFGYFDGTAYYNYPTATTYLANTWYKVKMAFDISQQKYWVWINDNLVTPSGIITKNDLGQIPPSLTNWRMLNAASGELATMWVDDLRIYKYANNAPSVSVSAETNAGYASSGSFVTNTIQPTGLYGNWGILNYQAALNGQTITVDVLDGAGNLILANVASGTNLNLSTLTYPSIKIRVNLTTADSAVTPFLNQIELNYTVDLIAPSVPGNLTFSSQTSSSIGLDWDDSTDADSQMAGYEVQRAPNSSGFPGSWVAAGGTCSGTIVTSSCQDSGLNANTKYWYRVRAKDNVGNYSGYSGEPSIDSNVVGLWRFNEGLGTTTADLSGNNNNLTLSGTSYWNASGKNGAAFNGVTANSNKATANTGPSSLDIGTNNFTIEAWIKYSTSQTAAYTDIASKYNSSGFAFLVSNSAPNVGKLYFALRDSSTIDGYSNNTSSLYDNAWHHVAVSVTRNSNATFYIDGNASGTINVSARNGSITDTSAGFTVGGYAGIYYPNGLVDEVRISNIARSQSNIQEAIQNPKSTTTTSISTPSGLVLSDVTSNSVALSWSNNSEPDFVGYKIERAPDVSGNPGAWTQIKDIPVAQLADPNNPSWVDNEANNPGSPPQPNTKYYYRIKAYSSSYTSASSGELSVTQNTVGLWHFNEGSGSTVGDSSPNGNTGSMNGSGYWASNGKFNSGFQGNNTSNFVNFGDKDIILGNTLTLEATVKFNGTGNQVIVGKNTNPTMAYTLQLNGGKVLFGVNGQYTTFDTTLQTGVWYYIVATYDGSKGRVYINGVKETTELTATGNVPNTSANLKIGAQDYPTAERYADAIIDEVRISDIALSQTDISNYFAEISLNPKSGVTIATTPALNPVTTPTNNNKPTITGTTSANAVVKLFDNGTEVAQTTASGLGNFTFGTAQYSQSLSEGAHTNISAKSYNSNNDPSPDSNVLSITVDSQPPTLPTNLALSSVTKDSITVSWEASVDPNLDGYIIQRATDLDGSPGVWGQVKDVADNATNWTDNATNNPGNSPQPNTKYYYRVKSYDSVSNETAFTGTVNTTTLTTVPVLNPMPYVNTVTPAITNEGSPDDIIANRLVHLYNNGSLVATSIANINGVFTFAGGDYTTPLNPGNNNLRVTVLNSVGVETNLNDCLTITVFVDTEEPGAPDTAFAWNNSDKEVVISNNNWNGHNNLNSLYFEWSGAFDNPLVAPSGLKQYYVYFGLNAAANPQNDGAATGNVVANITKTISSPASGTDYYFIIQAEDNAGNLSLPVTLFTYKFDNIVPSAPTSIVPNPAGFSTENSFSFQWPAVSDDASGVDHYLFVRKTSASQENYEEIDAINRKVTDVTDPINLNNVEAIYSGGANIIRIFAVDKAGNISNYGFAPYFFAGAVAGPANLAVSPAFNSTNSFGFSWDKPDGVNPKGYYVGTSVPLSPTNSAFIDTGVLPSESDIVINGRNAHVTISEEGRVVIEPFAAATAQGPSNSLHVVTRDEYDNVGWTTPSSVSFTVNAEPPAAPTELSITDASKRGDNPIWALTATWNPPVELTPDFTGYEVWRCTTGCDSDSNFSKVADVSTNIYSEANLSNFINYFYKVKSRDNIGNVSSFTQAASRIPTGKFATPPEFTSQPKVETKSSSVKIVWTTNRASNSIVQYGATTSYGQEVSKSTEKVTDHEVEILGLAPGTTYHYRVQSLDEDRDYDPGLAYSADYTFKTSDAPGISDVEVSEVRLSSAIITWKTTSSSTSKILYGTSTSYGKTYVDSSSSQTTTHTVKLEDLSDSTTYNFKIQGTDLEGNVLNSDNYIFTTLTYPRLSNLKVAQVQNTVTSTIKVNCDSNVPTTAQVTVSGVGGKEAATYDFANSHELLVSGLKDNTPYQITVKGRDQYGNEASSLSTQYKTDFDTRPPYISNLTVETSIVGYGADAKGQVVVSWTTDEPATSQVEFGSGVGGNEYSAKTQEDTGLVENHVVIISDLKPSAPYHFRVISKDSSGNSGISGDNPILTEQANDSVIDLVIKSLQSTIGWIFNVFSRK